MTAIALDRRSGGVDAARAGHPAAPPGAFAEMLLRQRSAVGLSQRELAQRAGLSERGFRDLERGAVLRPRRRSVHAVATALGLTGPDLASFLAAAGAVAGTVAGAVASDQPPSGVLIGRDVELRRLGDLVTGGRHRIVTVIGPAGVGKSRLAAELVEGLRRDGGAEVFSVDLSALRGPERVGEVVAEALGCGGSSRLRPVDRIAAHLHDRRVVLVLAGFERLVGAAPVVATLARRCRGLTVLVISQRPLHVTGELRVRLGGLAEAAALDLFTRRAAAVAPDFAVTPGNADAVRAICRQLDGLPLAIELAAARMRLLTPHDLAERLDRTLPVLTGGARDLPDRHRSLRAAVESSVGLVGPDAATVFTWLGAFAGGGRLADIEAVAAALGRDPAWLLGALDELVDTSLVRVADDDGASLYTLPDAMAELAAERLATGSGSAVVSRVVAAHYLHRVRQWHEDPGGPGRSVVHSDAGNLRAALGWAVTQEPELVDGSTVDALHRYFELTGRLAEGQATFVRVALAGAAVGWVRAGHLARLRGNFDEAARLGARAQTAIDATDHGGQALANLLLGSTNTERRRFGPARAHLRAALKHAGRAKDLRLVARALNNLGTLSMEMGRRRDAERLLAAALEAKRRSGAGPVDCGRTLYNLSENALDAGEFELASTRARAAVAELRSGGYVRLAAVAASVDAMARWRLNEPDGALAAAELAGRLAAESPETGEDRRTASLVGLRRSVVLHATGDRAGAASLVRWGVPFGLDGARRDWEEVAYAVEAHAALLAPTRPAGAAALLGVATRLRSVIPRSISAANASLIGETALVCRCQLGDAAYEREHRRGVKFDRAALVELLTSSVGDGRPEPPVEV